MNLYQVQQNILAKSKINTRKVNAWIYNNQSIVFDFLLNDYFISVSYTVQGKSFNFIERNKSKRTQTSTFPKFIKYISEIYGSYPKSTNQENTVLSLKFIEDDWSKIEEKFNEILEICAIYFGSSLSYILNVEKESGVNLMKYLDKPEIEYIGIKSNSNTFFLSHAHNHSLSNYVYALNSKGFLAVEHKMGISVFRRIKKHDYKSLLSYFPDSFNELDNIIYTVESPKIPNANKKNLLILFSDSNKSNENMDERYYSNPLPFIADSIMPNTYIVRIANVAGAFGSYGLNTKFDENIENNTQRFIKSLMGIYNVAKENVVICGSSLGATGAVYHGLIGGYKTFAIDPFLGNHSYYRGKDPLYLHSTHRPMLETFQNLPKEINHELENQVIISSAKVSEFYPEIKKLKESIPSITLCEFDFEKIKKHIDVADNTIFLSSTIINSLFLGVHMIDSDINLNQS